MALGRSKSWTKACLHQRNVPLDSKLTKFGDKIGIWQAENPYARQ